MAAITRFEEIQAWQLARKLTLRVYELTKCQPFDRDWSLKNQIRDAAGSSMHNIAEGFDASSDAEQCKKATNGFIRYLSP